MLKIEKLNWGIILGGGNLYYLKGVLETYWKDVENRNNELGYSQGENCISPRHNFLLPNIEFFSIIQLHSVEKWNIKFRSTLYIIFRHLNTV